MSAAAWVAIALVGGLGAVARSLIDAEITRRWPTEFPLGIFLVNLTGAFLIGLVTGSTLEGQALVVVGGGALGSFTTFSAWMLDSVRLSGARRSTLAWLNLALPVGLGFAAVWLGQALVA